MAGINQKSGKRESGKAETSAKVGYSSKKTQRGEAATKAERRLAAGFSVSGQ
jgi:hypothetical protein